MKAQERQDELLAELVEADNARSGVFFTASSSDGTVLFHAGEHVRDIEVGDVMGLATRGLLRITEYRDHGDVRFTVTDAGHAYIEAKARGGLSDTEVALARADRAETAMRGREADDEVARIAVQKRRTDLAMNLAWLPTSALAIVLSVGAYAVSQSGPLVVIFAVADILGTGASQMVAPLRTRIASRLIKPLAFIHDRT